MSRSILAGVFFLFINHVFAQKIQVLNQNTQEAIEGVIVYASGQSLYASSDIDGIVDLSIFNADSRLVFQHPSYHVLELEMNEISMTEAKIFLQEKIIRIDEVVISANKWEQNKAEIPFEILSLGAEDISSGNAQTAADMLESTGQVFVQKSQLGGGSPMIRGFGANAVLIVVDGVRMNNTIFRSGNLQNVINIDPNALESSEVIFGPGAVIYGSDALGGVIDFHTIAPRFSKDNKVHVDGHALVRYSSANNEKTANALLTIGKGNFSYAGNFSISDFGDLLTGSIRPENHSDFGKRLEYIRTLNGKDSIIQNSDENLQRFSGFKQVSTLQKFTFRIKDHLELGYTFNFSTTTDIPRYDRLIEYNDDTLKYAQWYYGPQKWMMNAIKLKYYKPNMLFDAVKVTTAFQNFEESRHDRKYRKPQLRNRFEKVNVFTINGDFEKVFDPKNQLYYGLEYNFNHVNSSAYELDVETNERSELSTRYPGGGRDVHSAALYSSYKRSIKDNLHLSAGLRYSYQNLDSRFNDLNLSYSSIQNKSSAINGNIGAVYIPNLNWNVSGMLSTGFRAPNVDDISKVFDSEPGNVVVPNPTLKPEYSYNSEISLTRYVMDKIEVNGTAFYSFLHNAMVRGDYTIAGKDSIVYDGELSKVQAIVNTGRAHSYGFNIGFKMDLSANWATSMSFNYTEGKDLIADEALRHTTPVFGMASLFYNQNKFKSEFYVRFNGKRKFEDLPPSERSKPHLYSSDGSLAWYTMNLRLQYQINDFLGLNGAIENILDHHYRTYSSGISAPGRNFVISLKANI